MSQSVRLSLAALSFFALGILSLPVLHVWHPLWMLQEVLQLDDPPVGCVGGPAAWLSQVYAAFLLGWTALGLISCLLAARGAAPAFARPLVAGVAGIQALLGLGALLVLVTPAHLLYGPNVVLSSVPLGVGFHPLQPVWALLHFLPLWAVRPPLRGALLPALAFLAASAVFFTVTTRIQRGRQEAACTRRCSGKAA